MESKVLQKVYRLSIPQPDQFSFYYSILLPWNPFQYCPSTYAYIFEAASFLRVVQIKPVCVSLRPYTCYMSCRFHPYRFGSSSDIWWALELQIIDLVIMKSYPVSCYFNRRSKYLHQPPLWIFVVTPRNNNVKYFIVQLMHSIIWIVGY